MLKRFLLQIGKVQKRVEILTFFLGRRPLKSEFEGSNPEKARVQNRTRRLSYQTCESVQNCDL